MNALAQWLLCLHIACNLVWIGSIVSAGFLLGRAPEIARTLFTHLSNPALLGSGILGAVMISLSPAYYLHAHWMHGKLTVALIAVGLTHAIGARARRLTEKHDAGQAANAAASSNVSGDPSSRQIDKVGANLTVALLACAILAVAFVTALKAAMS